MQLDLSQYYWMELDYDTAKYWTLQLILDVTGRYWVLLDVTGRHCVTYSGRYLTLADGSRRHCALLDVTEL